MVARASVIDERPARAAGRIEPAHYDPERDGVVSTNRRPPAQNLAGSCVHALRLVFATAALRQNKNCWG